MNGYSEQQLAEIQGQWSFRFPPDLMDLYRKRRSVLPKGFDWIKTPNAEIRRMLDWPLKGLLFDLKHNTLWLNEWGEKPAKAAEAEDVVRAAVAAAPRLIPIQGHRYIPETPQAAGNPVFSVWQSDIIIYGADLEDYIAHEMRQKTDRTPPIKRIRFWSQFTDE